MPDIKTVIVEEEDPYGPYGAKSVREICCSILRRFLKIHF